MLDYAEPVTKLIDELRRLPGVGGKSAQRIAFHILRARIEDTERLIAASNPNTEGAAAANYVGQLLRPLGVRITRIAMGVPVGSDLDYTDEVTMHKSLVNRHEL